MKKYLLNFFLLASLLVYNGNLLFAQNALNFYGTESAGDNTVQQDFVSIPDNGTLDLNQTFTIEAWIFVTDAADNTIIDKGNYQYLFQTHSNKTTGLGLYRKPATTGTDPWVYSGGTVPLNQWCHVAVTFDQPNSLVTFYLNGQVLGTPSTKTILTTLDNGPITIGKQDPLYCACNFFDGSMDELRIWNRALTQCEISTNMNCETPLSTSGLLAMYHFNQGIAGGNNTIITTLTDASGKGNDGILTKFAKIGTTGNFVAAGNPSLTNCIATATPTITTQPSATAVSYCQNDVASPLTVSATGTGLIYRWYRNTTGSNLSGTFISGATSASYTPPTTTAVNYYYFCIVYNSLGCSVRSNVSGLITVNPLPTITGATTVPVGFTTTLVGLTPADATNPWTSSDITKATVSNTGVVTGVATGGVTITYKNSNGCVKTFAITVVSSNVFYSQGSVSVNLTTSWKTAANAQPSASALTDGNNEFVIQAGHNMTASGGTFKPRNLTIENTGSLVMGTNLLNFPDASSVLTLGGILETNGTISTAPIIINDLGGAGELRFGSVTWTGITSATGTFFDTFTNKVTFFGTTALNIPTRTSYPTLQIEGTGVKKLVINTLVNKDFIIISGGNFNGGSNILTINGDFQNSGTFTAVASTVAFTGTDVQNITGTTTFYGLTVNNVGGYVALGISSPITANVLTLTNGRLKIGDNDLNYTGSNANITGPGWVETDGTGVFRNTKTGTFAYPIGNDTRAQKLTMINSTGTNTARFGISSVTLPSLSIGSWYVTKTLPSISINELQLLNPIGANSTSKIAYRRSAETFWNVINTSFISPDYINAVGFDVAAGGDEIALYSCDVPTITGPTTVIIGNSITLTGSGMPSSGTPWMSSDNAVAKVGNKGTVTGVAAGTTTITYTDNFGCTATYVVNVVNCDPLTVTLATDNNPNGGGDCGDLRYAINHANSTAGKDTVRFNITGIAPFKIALKDTLPIIKSELWIDGRTQSDYVNITGDKDDATLLPNYKLAIEIDGGGTLDYGIQALRGSLMLRGLSIGGFTKAGILASDCDTVAIEGCYIGLRPDGSINANGIGVDIDLTGVTSTAMRYIGGGSRYDCNFIAGNTSDGIRISNAKDFYVIRNIIGLDPDGKTVKSNGGFGVNIVGSTNVSVGIEGLGFGNVISGNALGQVSVNSSTGTQFYKNRIGVAFDGTTALTNPNSGIAFSDSKNSIIGSEAFPNIIANNTDYGITMTGTSSTSNKIISNSIYANKVGIDIASVSQDGILQPVINTATLNGDGSANFVLAAPATLPNIKSVSFYADADNGTQVVQGKVFLTTLNYSSTNTYTLNADTLAKAGSLTKFTAIQTSSSGSSSEFSDAAILAPYTPPTQPLGNRGLYFDGVDDYATIPASVANFSGSSNFTIEMWVKNQGLGGQLFNKVVNGGSGPFAIWTAISNSGAVVFNLANNGNAAGWDVLTTNASLESNKWYHIAFEKQGSFSRIYINGAKAAERTLSGATTAGTADNITDINLGRFRRDNNNYFKGQLDELRISNIARYNGADFSPLGVYTVDANTPNLYHFDNTLSNNQVLNDEGSTPVNGVKGSSAATVINDPLWALRVTDNTDNSTAGLGSLRQAITEANTDADQDYIDFSVGDGIQTIKPTSTYTLSTPVLIDGFSQYNSTIGENSTPNSNAFGLPINSKLNVIINGANAGTNNAFLFTREFAVVKGLVVNGYTNSIAFNFNDSGQTVNYNKISGCFIGTDRNGIQANANNVGFSATQTSVNRQYNVIGGSTDADRNLISGNNYGISDFNYWNDGTIQNNYIGTNANGTAAIPNQNGGINSIIWTKNCTITDNIISGNIGNALVLGSTGIGNITIKRNRIGTSADGSASLPNTGNGIQINDLNTNTIGGALNDANIIANNGGIGILISNSAANKNKISRNSIFNNSTKGISLVNGNNNKIAPVITSATTTTISGTGVTGDSIEVFSNVSPFSGKVQGKTYLQSTKVVGGKWSITGTFTLGDSITSTATDASNNTSEFSDAKVVAVSFVKPNATAATLVSKTGFRANWTKSGAASYDLDISTSSNFAVGTFSIFTAIKDTFHVATGLAANTVYYYRVRNTGDATPSNFKMTSTILPPGSGNGLTFDGTSNYITVPHNPSLDFGKGDFSMEAWVKRDKLGTRMDVISKNQVTIDPNKDSYYQLLIENDNKVRIYTSNGGLNEATAGATIIPSNQWVHLAAVRSGTTTSIYVNGVLDGTGTSTHDVNSSDDLHIGTTFSPTSVPNSLFSGNLDEVKLWNKALTQADIQNQMCQKLTGSENGLVCYFRFDENTGTITENKAKGSTVDGTILGAPTWGYSGAPIGDVSKPEYTTSVSSVSFSNTDKLTIDNFSIAANQGIQVYKVNEAPSQTTKGLGLDSLRLNSYFGVFPIGITDYKVTYEYSGLTGKTQEKSFTFASRADNSIATWTKIANTTLDMVNKTVATPTNPLLSGQKEIIGAFAPPPAPGAALDFDGVDDRVTSNSLSVADLGINDFTLEAWFKTSSPGTGTIVSNRVASSGGPFFSLYMNAAGGVGYEIRDNAGVNDKAFITTQSYADGAWHHIAVSRTANGITGYIDGIEFANETTTAPANVSNSNGLFVGYRYNGGTPDWFFKGKIDEVRLWKKALCLTEILNNKDCDSITNKTNLLVQYSFNQSIAEGNNVGLTTVADSSGNGNNATMVGFNLNGTSSNWVAPSKIASGSACKPMVLPVGTTWTWTGSVSKDWFSPCNWDMLSVPNLTSDVIIPGQTPNQPTIAGASMEAQCNTISIITTQKAMVTVDKQSGATLKIGK